MYAIGLPEDGGKFHIRLYRENDDDLFITKRRNITWAIASHKGVAYISGHYDNSSELLNRKNYIRKNIRIKTLCSHDGVFYCADVEDSYDLREVFSGKKIAHRKGWIYALCSHDGKLYDGGDYNKIYDTFSDTIVAEREHNVSALCSHDGKLYDAGRFGRVYETMAYKELVNRGNCIINALCSYKGKLLDAGSYGI